MVEQQAMGVPTEMAELYEIFRVNDEGTLLTLLPTTMPVGILDMVFRFEQDPAEDALRQNTGNMTKKREADRSRRTPCRISRIPGRHLRLQFYHQKE